VLDRSSISGVGVGESFLNGNHNALSSKVRLSP
jgi:hypothetical protein